MMSSGDDLMKKNARVYKSAKTDILDTARKILIEEGLGHLTTDNLIEKTGLSKGGFFYHFKTIDDLILTLTETLLTEMEADIYERASKDPVKKGATLRASINQAIDDTYDHLALCRSLTEVLFGQSLLDAYAVFFERYKTKVFNEGIDKMTAMTVLYALDGYWYGEMFNFEGYTKKDKKSFLRHLITLI
jgi:AcrR family transcriptional regulator